MELSDEKWMSVNVKGYEAFYEVSDKGRVRSLDRIVSKDRHIKGRVLKSTLNNDGYPMIVMSVDNAQKTIAVHRLVATSWLRSGMKKGYQVNHIDGDKTNNHLENLEWVTASRNVIHSLELGLRVMAKGEERPSSKYNERIVRNILSLYYKDIMLPKEIGTLLGIHEKYVVLLYKGKRWRHVRESYSEKYQEYFRDFDEIASKRSGKKGKFLQEVNKELVDLYKSTFGGADKGELN